MKHLLRSTVLAAALALAPLASADQFDTYHPDQYYRRTAMQHWENGEPEAAHRDFLSAAKYADKTSQLSLALQYWTGSGVAADRPTAYAWADLAAERGYPDFLSVRERMWAELTPEEQARAVEIGTRLYAQYGDDVAKKRLERLLRKGLGKKTGTRTASNVSEVGVIHVDGGARAALQAGFNAGNLSSFVKGAKAAAATRLDLPYWDERNWKPQEYWATQDALWKPDPRGTVTVGPLTANAPAETPKAE